MLQKNKQQLVLPLLLVGSIMVAALYLPGLHETYQTNKELISQKEEVVKKKQTELAQLEKEFSVFQTLPADKKQEMIQKFFDTVLQDELLTTYENLKKTTGVSIQSISFTKQPQETTSSLQATAIAMDIVAPTKEQVEKAIEFIEQQKRIMKITSINLQNDKTQARAALTLNVYSNR